METQVEDSDTKKFYEVKDQMQSNIVLEKKFKFFCSKNKLVLEMPTPKSYNRSDCLDFKPKNLKQIRFQ